MVVRHVFAGLLLSIACTSAAVAQPAAPNLADASAREIERFRDQVRGWVRAQAPPRSVPAWRLQRMSDDELVGFAAEVRERSTQVQTYNSAVSRAKTLEQIAYGELTRRSAGIVIPYTYFRDYDLTRIRYESELLRRRTRRSREELTALTRALEVMTQDPVEPTEVELELGLEVMAKLGAEGGSVSTRDLQRQAHVPGRGLVGLLDEAAGEAWRKDRVPAEHLVAILRAHEATFSYPSLELELRYLVFPSAGQARTWLVSSMQRPEGAWIAAARGRVVRVADGPGLDVAETRRRVLSVIAPASQAAPELRAEVFSDGSVMVRAERAPDALAQATRRLMAAWGATAGQTGIRAVRDQAELEAELRAPALRLRISRLHGAAPPPDAPAESAGLVGRLGEAR
jgi:hypothetical protein